MTKKQRSNFNSTSLFCVICQKRTRAFAFQVWKAWQRLLNESKFDKKTKESQQRKDTFL